MKKIFMFAVAASLATLAACSTQEAAPTAPVAAESPALNDDGTVKPDANAPECGPKCQERIANHT